MLEEDLVDLCELCLRINILLIVFFPNFLELFVVRGYCCWNQLHVP